MSEDFLNISVESAIQSAQRSDGSSKGGRKTDTRFWKPNIKNESKEYQAKIRLLPRGITGIKNKLHPTVEQHVHYIKEPKYGLYLTAKCRKSLGSHEHCPICEANWAMYNTKIEALVTKAKARRNTVTHIGNILVRADLNDPTMDGFVKLWEHTSNMNKMLFAPLNAEEEKAGGFKKKQDKFNPYSPRNGRDFIVIVTENPENGFPDYNGSFWDDEGFSDIAGSQDEIMAVLDQCYDLSEFINDIPSVEDLGRQYNDFCVALAEKENSSAEVNAVRGSAPVFTGSNNPAAQNVTQGNATAYLAPKSTPVAESVQEEADELDLNEQPAAPAKPTFKKQSTPTAAPAAPAPKKAAPAPMLNNDDSSDDDELPF